MAFFDFGVALFGDFVKFGTIWNVLECFGIFRAWNLGEKFFGKIAGRAFCGVDKDFLEVVRSLKSAIRNHTFGCWDFGLVC